MEVPWWDPAMVGRFLLVGVKVPWWDPAMVGRSLMSGLGVWVCAHSVPEGWGEDLVGGPVMVWASSLVRILPTAFENLIV